MCHTVKQAWLAHTLPLNWRLVGYLYWTHFLTYTTGEANSGLLRIKWNHVKTCSTITTLYKLYNNYYLPSPYRQSPCLAGFTFTCKLADATLLSRSSTCWRMFRSSSIACSSTDQFSTISRVTWFSSFSFNSIIATTFEKKVVLSLLDF